MTSFSMYWGFNAYNVQIFAYDKVCVYFSVNLITEPKQLIQESGQKQLIIFRKKRL